MEIGILNFWGLICDFACTMVRETHFSIYCICSNDDYNLGAFNEVYNVSEPCLD